MLRAKMPTTLPEPRLDKMLTEYETIDPEQGYKAFEQLEGIGETHITDASTTINEVLYGGKGVKVDPAI